MSTKFDGLNRCVTLVIFCLLIFQSGSAQNLSAVQQSPQQIAAKVDEYMNAALKIDSFSGSVLIARDGQPIVSKGYGLANYELDVPNTPQTVFRIGSVTKQFTSMAIMMLQERGKLSTNDSICKYFSDCPNVWQPVTLRHLLTHTSGIPNFSGFPELRKNAASLPITAAEMLTLIKSKPMDFVQGENIKYGNSGYYLLGLIIERQSGKSYADFLQENIFAPLGMKQTGYDDTRRIIKNRAAGYLRQGDSIINARYIDMSIPFAAGGLYSTTEDLLLWDKALYTEKLVSRKSLDEMLTPFKDLQPGKGYAYGWWLSKRFDRQEIAHGSAIAGFVSYIARFPSERVTVIVLTNNENGSSGRVANDLSAIVFGAPYKILRERKAITIASSILDKYVGQYKVQLPPTTISISYENEKLMAQLNTQPKIEMFAESETDFFLKTADVQFTFVKDTQGGVTRLIVHQGDSTLFEILTAQKIK